MKHIGKTIVVHNRNTLFYLTIVIETMYQLIENLKIIGLVTLHIHVYNCFVYHEKGIHDSFMNAVSFIVA